MPRGCWCRRRPASTANDAACAAVTFGTVEHMLFDNARLEPGETILVHAGGSGSAPSRSSSPSDGLHRHRHRRLGRQIEQGQARSAPTMSSTTARTASRASRAS